MAGYLSGEENDCAPKGLVRGSQQISKQQGRKAQQQAAADKPPREPQTSQHPKPVRSLAN